MEIRMKGKRKLLFLDIAERTLFTSRREPERTRKFDLFKIIKHAQSVGQGKER